MGMNIRPTGTAGLHLTYAVGSFAAEDDALVIQQLGGDSPFGGVLCSMGSDYAVHVSPDGYGRSTYAGLDLTTPLGAGKAWYIRDCESGQVWSPFFSPVCEKADEHELSFLPGQVKAYTLKNKIASTLTIATVPDKSVEVWLLRLENHSADERRLSFTTYVEPCIGANLETTYKDRQKTLLMRRPLGAEGQGLAGFDGGDVVLFHSSTLVPVCLQTDKSAFLGDGRTLRNPQQLDQPVTVPPDHQTSKTIASFTIDIELPIEGEAEIGFCFGVARSPENALELVRGCSKVRLVSEAIEASRLRWERLSSAVQAASPDRALNALVNTWLPYDAYAGWIRQRTGGVCLDPNQAIDALRRLYALTATAPGMCRANLLDFAAGISIAGHYSPDNESTVVLPARDLLWLVYSTARYVAETGDVAVLAEAIPARGTAGLNLEEHCERILRMYAGDPSADPVLVESVLDTWAASTGSCCDIDLEDRAGSLPADKSDQADSRGLPRRVRYFQSLTPAMADQPVREWVVSGLSSGGSHDGETGVACCAYSALVEVVLGLKPAADGLLISPRLPDDWDECRVIRQFRGDTYHISISRALSSGASTASMIVDGEPVLGNMIPLFGDGGQHTVDIVVGGPLSPDNHLE